MCEFWKPTHSGVWADITTIMSPNIFKVLNAMNVYMFLFTNLIFLLALILMGFRISYIKDNLSLTRELITVVVVWITCSTVQYAFYFSQTYYSCYAKTEDLKFARTSYICAFWTI